MNKLIFKFSLAFVLLLNTLILYFFYQDTFLLIEPYLYPLFFIYFIVDSFSILIPKYNTDIYSSKMLKSKYVEVENYNKKTLKEIKRRDDKIALLIFVLYFGGIAILGLSYIHFDWFTKIHIYLLFFFFNFSDYFCIMMWCPFRSVFLKNSCCNTCRISNWDRIMKFSILIFIPNIYTISIFILGVFIFLQWEYLYHRHPERFFRLSNETLRCNSCDKVTCGKKSKNTDIKKGLMSNS